MGDKTMGILIIAGFLFLIALSGISTAVFFALRDRRTSENQVIAELICAIDADCPPDFTCVNGYCVPEQA